MYLSFNDRFLLIAGLSSLQECIQKSINEYRNKKHLTDVQENVIKDNRQALIQIEDLRTRLYKIGEGDKNDENNKHG